MAYAGEHFEIKVPSSSLTPLERLRAAGGRLLGGQLKRVPGEYVVAPDSETPWERVTRSAGRAIIRSQSLGRDTPSLEVSDGVAAKAEWLTRNVTLPLVIDDDLQSIVDRLMESRGRSMPPEAEAVCLFVPSEALITNSRHVRAVGLVAVHDNVAVGDVSFRDRPTGRLTAEQLHDLETVAVSIGVHVDEVFNRNDPGIMRLPAPPIICSVPSDLY